MATPESRVKKAINKVLAKFGDRLYYEMPVPGGYGKSGLDYCGCAASCYFAIEAKADETKEPTDRQKKTIRDMQKAGAVVFVIQGTDDPDLAKLEAWLTGILGVPQ
jgi:hypothetical protein